MSSEQRNFVICDRCGDERDAGKVGAGYKAPKDVRPAEWSVTTAQGRGAVVVIGIPDQYEGPAPLDLCAACFESLSAAIHKAWGGVEL